MKRAVAFTLLAASLLAAPASAELNGALYAVPGATIPIGFMFSVSGQDFVAAILTFGGGGNGRFFLATGTTDGASGSGVVLSPQGFGIPVIPSSSFQFQLDQDGNTGTFTITTTGLSSFLSQSSGTLTRVVP
jgi:hypothetical protein